MRPNHVWCADVTYIPLRRGFLYLVAIMDWATRKVLAWRLSNTMDAGFVAALEEALARFGKTEIFNTDQGSQFTPQGFTSMLRDAERISMDWGRWMRQCSSNAFGESLEVRVRYLQQRDRLGSCGLGRWYLLQHPASETCGRTPVEAYQRSPRSGACPHDLMIKQAT